MFACLFTVTVHWSPFLLFCCVLRPAVYPSALAYKKPWLVGHFTDRDRRPRTTHRVGLQAGHSRLLVYPKACLYLVSLRSRLSPWPHTPVYGALFVNKTNEPSYELFCIRPPATYGTQCDNPVGSGVCAVSSAVYS